jgi:hypothetical protein
MQECTPVFAGHEVGYDRWGKNHAKGHWSSIFFSLIHLI